MDLELSTTQLGTFRTIGPISCLLSIAGSLLIVRSVLSTPELKSFERLVLGLSVADVCTSVRILIFSMFFRPYSEPSVACTVDGLFHIAGGIGPFYNAFLSFHFLLIVVYGVRDDRVAGKYEPIMHGLSIVVPTVGALVGVFLESFNPQVHNNGWGCGVYPYPNGCLNSEKECERGGIETEYYRMFCLLLMVFVLVSLVVNNCRLYLKVRRVERNTRQYQFRASTAITSGQSSAETRSRARQVATQSILYVLAFLLSSAWTLVSQIFLLTDPQGFASGRYFVVQVAEVFFYPFQGFFNMVVFFRPSYLRLRANGFSRWEFFLLEICRRDLSVVRANSEDTVTSTEVKTREFIVPREQALQTD